MKLRVSPQTGMWGFGTLWLTFADTAPLEIDENSLDGVTQEAVRKGLARGALIDLDAKPVTLVPKVISVPVVSDKPIMSPIPLNLKQKLTILLENGVTTLRREIALIKHIPTLTWALRMEREGKQRKTIIDLIEKQLAKSGNPNVYEDIIKEEEGETITLKLERMSIVSVEEKNPETGVLEVATEVSPENK